MTREFYIDWEYQQLQNMIGEMYRDFGYGSKKVRRKIKSRKRRK